MWERTWLFGEHELSLLDSGSIMSFMSGVYSSLAFSLRTFSLNC